ncbi:MAG: hypothetical protein Q9218_001051 [Villophora microphyllina]
MAKTRDATARKEPDRFVPTTAAPTRQTAPKKKSATRISTGNTRPGAKTLTSKVKDTVKDAAGTAGTKANTSKPRAKKPADKKVKEGRVTKTKKATNAAAAPKKETKKAAAPKKEIATKEKKESKTKNEREPGIVDVVQGVTQKIVGAVTGNPATKAKGTKKLKGTDGKGAKRAKKE